MKVLGLLLLIATPHLFAADQTWSYADQASWPGICTTGHEQSPIALTRGTAQAQKYQPLVCQDCGNVDVTGENDGNTLKWSVQPQMTHIPLFASSPMPSLHGGPLLQGYSLVQFHLQWPSEHPIDGLTYPLEFQLLHRRSDLTLDDATQYPDGLAVVVIPCQVSSDSEESNLALSQIMPDVPELQKRNSQSSKHLNVDINGLLGSNNQSYFTYHGSLTTPDCQEAVTWIVLDNPIIISDTHSKAIHSTDVGGATNNRDLQAQNNRTVYHSHFFETTTILERRLKGRRMGDFQKLTT